MFAVYRQHDRSDLLAYLPVAMGLIASAVAAFLLCPEPRPQADGLGTLLLSTIYIALTVTSGAAILATGDLLGGRHGGTGGAVVRLLLSFCGVAAWMASVVTLYERDAPGIATVAVAVATALGWRLIRDYHSSRVLADTPHEDTDPAAAEMFAAFATAGFSRQVVRMVVAVACVQAAVFAEIAGAVGGFVLLLGAAIGVVLSSAAGLHPKAASRRRKLQKTVAHICGAVALVAIAVRSPALVRLPVSSSAKSAEGSPVPAHLRSADLLSGVILLPRSPRMIKLVAPAPSRATTPLKPTMAPPPVPFSGEYWILPMGHMGPPENAVVERAAPTEYNFKAVDGSPLMMLARQRLHAPVSIRCCSAVRVKLRNLDREPDTIALQVNLLASSSGKMLRQPLDRIPLPASELATLDYAFPADSLLSRFEKVEFYFHLLGKRKHRSANVAIVGFEFTPRTR